eukprot:CAMPEP_0181255082 /NCGR_PEP_ID=MMETSP1096-20121128/48957_1 /TAXON_ID=156174 ORGANISM="Chrysochromulina ericina, Strain CCMP281" /NCGR_SAMPLE_ID=MMETSP1096 /ASSEMBLY_ACC=CAM_ASM_000453 /LENGTH=98 /DNA_ID=CAMNT_0023353181 /DNA_START=499 /DNA_END=792 /DNA_ORIENTATION=-
MVHSEQLGAQHIDDGLHMIVPVLQQKGRGPAVRFRAENEEVRLGSLEQVWSSGRLLEAISSSTGALCGNALGEERACELHRALTRIAVVNLQLTGELQ